MSKIPNYHFKNVLSIKVYNVRNFYTFNYKSIDFYYKSIDLYVFVFHIKTYVLYAMGFAVCMYWIGFCVTDPQW